MEEKAKKIAELLKILANEHRSRAATDLHQILHDLAALFRRETALLSEGFF